MASYGRPRLRRRAAPSASTPTGDGGFVTAAGRLRRVRARAAPGRRRLDAGPRRPRGQRAARRRGGPARPRALAARAHRRAAADDGRRRRAQLRRQRATAARGAVRGDLGAARRGRRRHRARRRPAGGRRRAATRSRRWPPPRSAASGTTTSSADWLRRAGVDFERPDDVAEEVAEALAADGIVAWFQGRSEFGPRALGHRSLLADPRRLENLERLNDVKGREQFRPVAPMVLEEHAPAIFDGRHPVAAHALRARRRRGVAGADPGRRARRRHGARADRRPRRRSRSWPRMLEAFDDRTGVPVVVNTSLNTAGRPMVDDPRDALECFGSAPVDLLAIGPFVVRRRAAPRASERALEDGGVTLRRRHPDHRARRRSTCCWRALGAADGPLPERVLARRRPPGRRAPRSSCARPRRCAAGSRPARRRRAGRPRPATSAGARRRRRGSRSSTTTSSRAPGWRGDARRRPARPAATASPARRAASASRCRADRRPTDWERNVARPRARALGDRRPRLPPRGAGGRRRLRRALPARLPRGHRPRPAADRARAGRSCRGAARVAAPGRHRRPLGVGAQAGRQRRRRADGRRCTAATGASGPARRAAASAATRRPRRPAWSALVAAAGRRAPRRRRGRRAVGRRHGRVRLGAHRARPADARGDRHDARSPAPRSRRPRAQRLAGARARASPARAPPTARRTAPPRAVLLDRDGTLVLDVPYNGDPALVGAAARACARRSTACAPRGVRLGDRLQPERHRARPADGRAGRGRDGAHRRAARPVRRRPLVPARPGGRLRVPQARARPAAGGRRRRSASTRGAARDRRHRRRRRGRARRRDARACWCRRRSPGAEEIAAAPEIAPSFAVAVERLLRGRAVMRALVVRLDNDGDVLLAGPAIRAVAAGADHVTLLCGPRGAAAARAAARRRRGARPARRVDRPRAAAGRSATTSRPTSTRSRRCSADVAVVLTSFHQSPLPIALLLRLAGVPRIAAISEDYPGLAARRTACPIPATCTRSARALGVAAALGFALPAGDDGRLAVARRRAGGRAARRATSSSTPARRSRRARGRPSATASWSPRSTDAGREVVVTGAPAERELTAFVARRRATDLGGATSLAELAGVLAGAEAVVVGNTGPAHLAAAVGTPVVSLFAPTVPAARWRPWGVPHELLLVDVPCAGCRARVCPVAGHPVPGRGDRRRRARRARPPRTCPAAGGGRMRILLWHVHGSWTTAFVSGAARVRRAGRCPTAVPTAAAARRPGTGRRRSSERTPRGAAPTTTSTSCCCSARTSCTTCASAGPAAGPGATCRRSTSSTTRRRGGSPTCAIRRPTATICSSPRHALQRALLGLRHDADAGHRARRSSIPGSATRASSSAPRVVINEARRRGRVTGTDLLARFAAGVPIDLFGMDAAALGGIEDLPQDRLHDELARRRCYLHPIRWTSLGLSLIEAMHLGMPVVALATTEAVEAVPPRGGRRLHAHRRAGRGGARAFLARPGRRREAGRAARAYALERFGLERFLADWDDLLGGGDQPMRIALVSEHASPLAVLGGVDAGGQNVHVAALARALARRGRARSSSTPAATTRRCRGASRCAPASTSTTSTPGRPRSIPKDELLPHMDAFAARARALLARRAARRRPRPLLDVRARRAAGRRRARASRSCTPSTRSASSSAATRATPTRARRERVELEREHRRRAPTGSSPPAPTRRSS